MICSGKDSPSGAKGIAVRTSIWARWMARYGAPRAFLAVQARRGQPLARFLLGRASGDEMYRLVEDIRTQGRLVQRPFVWVSADHEICRTVLRDDAFGVTNIVNAPLPQPFPALLDRTDPGLPNPVERPAMVMTNPPDHTRYRRLFAQSFTPRAIDGLSARVEEITAELLDGLARKPQPDLVAEFATELPVAVIAEILGLPIDARPQVREWGYTLAPLLDFGTSWKTFRHAIERLREVDRYAAQFVERARAGESGDDPLGRVAAGGELTQREFAANAALLVGAGFETTVNLIGNGIVLLLNHPQQLALLRDDPGLWPGAIEEILRFESPVQMLVRTARRDVEIAGEHIRAGAMFVLLMPRRGSGANRGRHRPAHLIRPVPESEPARAARTTRVGDLARVQTPTSRIAYPAGRRSKVRRTHLVASYEILCRTELSAAATRPAVPAG